MKKISNAQIAEVLADAALTLRQQQGYIHELEEKVASYQLRDRTTKIAQQMHSKGLDDTPVEELASRLDKLAQQGQGKLDVYEEAVKLAGADMGTKLAQLADGDTRGSPSGTSDFERFITGTVG